MYESKQAIFWTWRWQRYKYSIFGNLMQYTVQMESFKSVRNSGTNVFHCSVNIGKFDLMQCNHSYKCKTLWCTLRRICHNRDNTMKHFKVNKTLFMGHWDYCKSSLDTVQCTVCMLTWGGPMFNDTSFFSFRFLGIHCVRINLSNFLNMMMTERYKNSIFENLMQYTAWMESFKSAKNSTLS